MQKIFFQILSGAKKRNSERLTEGAIERHEIDP